MLNSKGSARYYGTIKSFLSEMPNPIGSTTITPNHAILSIQISGTQEVQSNTAEPSKVLLNDAKP